MDSSADRYVQLSTDLGYFSALDRARIRWGLEQSVLMRADGAEHDLARALQRALRHLPVIMLHDRLLPDGTLVEHLAIGPGGVTVVARWSTGEPPAIRARVTVVQELIGELAAVEGALCLDAEEPAAPPDPLEVEGIVVAGPKAVAALAARDGDLRDYELTALVDFIDAQMPPAF
jgi:hypothetical protein